MLIARRRATIELAFTPNHLVCQSGLRPLSQFTHNKDRLMTKANRTAAKGMNCESRVLTLALRLFAVGLVMAGAIWALQPRDSLAEEITLYKNASCMCCKRWANLLRGKGYEVVERDVDDLDSIKAQFNVGQKYQGCHTALIGGYVIEGHVPVKEIDRLLRERPDAKGLSVPGMPVGSPGMEMPGRKPDSFTVLLMKKDGSSEVYARY